MHDEVADELLRSALELAVDVAAAGARLRPPLASPPGLRPLLRMKRLGAAQLARVRQEVEADPSFRSHLAAVATPDLVDEPGREWLAQEPGWAERLAALAAARGMAAGPDARREQRRRAAALEAAERERADHAATHRRLEREREQRDALAAELVAAASARDAALAERDALRAEVAALRSRLRAAEVATAGVHDDVAVALGRAAAAEAARDTVLSARAGEPLVAAGPVDVTIAREAYEAALAALGAAQAATRRIGPALEAAAAAAPVQSWPPPGIPARRRTDRPRRTPLAIPGGLVADSAAVTEHLLRVPGVVVLVDGYNVAKLGWPSLELAAQRERLVGLAEDIARRWATDVTIVFDGADVPGASTLARRLVRVTFSPAEISADDVLRAEVDQLDHRRPVVVVTSDQAVVTDVRASGANTISSDQFLAVARR